MLTMGTARHKVSCALAIALLLKHGGLCVPGHSHRYACDWYLTHSSHSVNTMQKVVMSIRVKPLRVSNSSLLSFLWCQKLEDIFLKPSYNLIIPSLNQQ